MPDKITMVIPCYWATVELVDMTLTCINSANDTSDIGQTILVDDGSPVKLEVIDGTDFASDYEVIPRKKNGGYAAAVNTGLFYAKGDIIIVCNNDIEFIQPNWLIHLLKPLQEGYDIASIRTTDADGWETEDRIEADAKFGSIWAMKRKVYDTIGGLDESFGKGYFEDLDYQKRSKAAGFTSAKNHAGIVEHRGKATFRTIDPADDAYNHAMARFQEKWGKVE